MAGKEEIVHKGERIKVIEKKTYWELEFLNGTKEKIFYHVNEQQHSVWMWESGRIDEEAHSIGKLIEDLRLAK